MSFFGIGGLELVLVMLVALFIVGPVRLAQGARTARKYMTELRRQRDELTQMVEEAVDLEEVRNRLDEEGLTDAVRDLSGELRSFKEETLSVGREVDELKRAMTSVDRPRGYRRGESVSESDSDGNGEENSIQNAERDSEDAGRG